MTVVHVAKIAALNALLGGAALAAATQAGAQPVPVDPMLPPAPPAMAAPVPPGAPAPPAAPVFAYIPAGEAPAGGPVAAPVGPVAPPAPPTTQPYIAPVPNANFGNTGQFDFLKELWNMRNNPEFMQTVGPGQMDPATWVPPTPYGVGTPPPPPAPGSPAVPVSAPPPIWPPMPIPAPVP